MALYTYNSGSPIRQICTQISASGGLHIWLMSDESASPETIRATLDLLQQNGWSYIPTERSGEPCLEVRGVATPEALQNALSQAKLIQGNPAVTTQDNVRYTLRERIRSHRLLIAGVLNVIADIGILGYGHLKQKLEREINPWQDQAAGVAYSAGSLSLAAFSGGDKSGHRLSGICVELKKKMDQDGLVVQEPGGLDSFIAPSSKNAFDRAYRFASKHPSEIANALTAAAGGFIAWGAQNNPNTQTRIIDSLLGVSTLAGGTTAAFVREEPRDLNKPGPESVVGKIWQWIKDRPNRIAALGYLMGSSFHAWETLHNLIATARGKYGNEIIVNPKPHFTDGWRKDRLAYVTYGMRGVFCMANFVSEFLLMFSSKGNGGNAKDKSIEDITYAIVADTLSRAPAEKQEALIREYSHNFLARAGILGGKPQEVEQRLRLRMKNLQHNPWQTNARKTAPAARQEMPAQRTNWQEKLKQIPAPTLTPSLAHS